MATLLSELRHGIRILRRNPGFAAIAVLTLALGIGSTSAIFSIVDGALLRPLPFRDPDRLVFVWGRLTGLGLVHDRNGVSPPEVMDLRQRTRSFVDVAAYQSDSLNLTGEGEPERIDTARVSASLFPMLGVEPAAGRWFSADEDRPDSNVIVVSYELWQRRFGGDPNMVGRRLRLNDRLWTVTGVAPAGFKIDDPVGLWAPIAFTSDLLSINNRGAHYLDAIARLKPGVSRQALETDLNRLAGELLREFPDYYHTETGWAIRTTPMAEQLTESARPALLTLAGAVSLLLWIACANVANLLLVRGTARQKEIAVRLALGASRAALIRQLMAEGAVVALVAGALGLAIAAASGELLSRTLPADFAPLGKIHVDARVVAFTILVSLVTTMLFGLLPALRSARTGLATRSVTHGIKVRRVQGLVVISEIALALVLLTGAGLLMKSFLRLLEVDPGFNPRGVLSMRVSLPRERYATGADVTRFYRRALANLQVTPGIASAGLVSALPLSGSGGSGCFEVEDHPSDPTKKCPEGDRRPVSADYFKTMGIALVRGRAFDARDEAEETPKVVIIDETLAAKYWPGEDPIGRRMKLSSAKSDRPWVQVVGIVRHVHNRDLTTPSRVQMYWPFSQAPYPFTSFAVRAAAGDPRALAHAAERAIHEADSQLPLFGILTMEELVERSVAQRKLTMALLIAFAGLAVVLAAVGIYGVLAYGVAQRSREIAIRMAVGAERSEVAGMVGTETLRLAAAGVVLGVAAALGLARLAGDLLFRVSPADPAVYVAAAAVAGLAAALAGFVPARRAASVDPITALREE